MTLQSYEAATEAAIAEEMRLDESVFCMGTSPPRTLLAEFGPRRVRRTPIAESVMTGMAVGAAGSGLRPIVLWNNVTFSFVAFDQVVNQAAKIRYMFGAQRDFPIVFRASYYNGSRSAAQHSQTGYALYAHAGGLAIAVPAGVTQGKALMKAAIRDPNPVLFFESGRLANLQDDVDDSLPAARLGLAQVARRGADATVVAVGYMVRLALDAATRLAGKGISVEVIDPQTVVPLDLDSIRASVRRTGRLVVVDESFPTCSIASEIITSVVEDSEALSGLHAPPMRVCTAPVPIPFSPPLEDYVLPSVDGVCAAVLRTLAR